MPFEDAIPRNKLRKMEWHLNEAEATAQSFANDPHLNNAGTNTLQSIGPPGVQYSVT